MAVNAIGTALWIYDTGTSAVVKIGCPTNISGLGLSREITESDPCLETGETTKFTGKLTKNDISLSINWDPESASQQLLWDAVQAGSEGLSFVIGLSGDATAPTWSTGDWVLDTDRSWVKIVGAVASISADLALPAYKGSVTLSVTSVSIVKATT